MTPSHKWAVTGAIAAEILLLVGILFGFNTHPTWIGISSRTIREVCLSVWVVALPAWFVTESTVFAPDPKDPAKVAAFVKGQRAGQTTAVLLGAVVGAAIGFKF